MLFGRFSDTFLRFYFIFPFTSIVCVCVCLHSVYYFYFCFIFGCDIQVDTHSVGLASNWVSENWWTWWPFQLNHSTEIYYVETVKIFVQFVTIYEQSTAIAREWKEEKHENELIISFLGRFRYGCRRLCLPFNLFEKFLGTRSIWNYQFSRLRISLFRKKKERNWKRVDLI